MEKVRGKIDVCAYVIEHENKNEKKKCLCERLAEEMGENGVGNIFACGILC